MSKEVRLETAAQQFVEETAEPPYLYQLEPEVGRTQVDQTQAGDVDKPDVHIEDMAIEGGPSGRVSLRILRPKHIEGKLPVILYIHGAGWVFGNAHTHDRLIRELVVGSGAAVVFPNYSLAPEAQYPIALEEIYAVLKWIHEHAEAQQFNQERVAVAGDSVGGNMTAAITLMSKERSGPRIACQLMFYPVTDASYETSSYHQFAEGYFLHREGMKWFWDQYTKDPQQRQEITASPLRATIDQLRGLPPALIITAEADVLRDEGEAYADKLREAGVEVTAVRYLGIIHDFVMLNPLRETAAAQSAISLAGSWLKEQLQL